MAHVLVCGSAAPSHTLPHLALVAELVARGHRVSYANGEALRTLVAPTGASLLLRDSLLPAAGGDDAGVWPEDPVLGMQLFLDDAKAALPGLIEALDDDPPDLVGYDIGAHEGLVLAHRWGVPGVVLSPSIVAWDGYAEDMAEALAPIRASAHWAAYDTDFAAWYAAHDMPRGWEDAVSFPERGLALVPRPMQPNADRVGPHMRFVGPALGADRLEETWSPAGSGRTLYVASGTAYTDRAALYRAAAHAAADAGGWHVVISAGRVALDELADLPGSVEVHARVPQLAVLARADAFLTHAGMGSCAETLWQGVPAIAVPAAVDQFGNAAQLEAIGAGVQMLEADATPDRLRAALDAVTAEPVRARVGELRDEVRAAGGASHAADALEAFL